MLVVFLLRTPGTKALLQHSWHASWACPTLRWWLATPPMGKAS